MYCFADFLVLWCLFVAGYFLGYYCSFTYIYENVFPHWYAIVGILITLILAAIWTFQKYRRQQYNFNHYYIIFYGLICFVNSACFMLSDNLDVGFYFGFVGLGVIYISSFSFISLRCSSNGLRPMRIALGNTLFLAGITTGFILFNEFKPEQSGWIYLGLTILMLLGTIVNEILQYTSIQCYKNSCDLAFNLMNEEKFLFLRTKAIHTLFLDRTEFYIVKNRQNLIVGLTSLIVLERIFLFSFTFLHTSWSATFANLGTQYLYGPFLLTTLGGAIGTGLLVRYKAKLIYLMFALIKITATAAILGVFNELRVENCFYFLCFYYISMGVYSSIALQLILECMPFLYTECGLAFDFIVRMTFLEISKYEIQNEETWPYLLGLGIASMSMTVVCLVIVQQFMPPSEGLIEIRNRLLGIRRHRTIVPQMKIWNSNCFQNHDIEPNKFSNVCFEGNRVFQQYPRNVVNQTK